MICHGNLSMDLHVYATSITLSHFQGHGRVKLCGSFSFLNLVGVSQLRVCCFFCLMSFHCVDAQICLGVQGKNVLSSFDGLYDMEEQAQLREDCAVLVGECVCLCVCVL